jgi:hypothetical protein
MRSLAEYILWAQNNELHISGLVNRAIALRSAESYGCEYTQDELEELALSTQNAFNNSLYKIWPTQAQAVNLRRRVDSLTRVIGVAEQSRI